MIDMGLLVDYGNKRDYSYNNSYNNFERGYFCSKGKKEIECNREGYYFENKSLISNRLRLCMKCFKVVFP